MATSILPLSFPLCLFLLSSLLLISDAASSITDSDPQAFDSFNVSYIQKVGSSCSYTIVISTSCSSPKFTRDRISLAFGDGYGNQIYAPRLDNPSAKAFEQCSSDTFQIDGPCAHQICYIYLYRSGSDGWVPESVKIYMNNAKAVTFKYNTYVPADIWYGFNYCESPPFPPSSSHRQAISLGSLILVVIGFIASAMLV